MVSAGAAHGSRITGQGGEGSGNAVDNPSDEDLGLLACQFGGLYIQKNIHHQPLPEDQTMSR